MTSPAYGRPARIMTRREAALLSPTVLCSEPDRPALAPVAALQGQREWAVGAFEDVQRAAHQASVRETRLVLIAGANPGWLLRATKSLRAACASPIAVVAGPLDHDQVLALLGAGANLLIDRHCGPREVLARLTALCRGARRDETLRIRWLQAGELRVDLGARRCVLGEDAVQLSQNEFDLLVYLMRRSQQTVPPHEIVHGVWRWKHGDGLNTLRIHIGRLRRKLGDTPSGSRWIASVRGVGYQFLPPVAEFGDDRSEERLRETVATLNAQNDALYSIVDNLLAMPDVTALADAVVRWAVDRNFCDAATVFRLGRDGRGADISTLVASAGMSSRWTQSLAAGHPVEPGFMGAHAYRSGKVVQLSDVSRLAGRFPVTARMSSAEDLHACVLFPLFVGGRVWGDLAFVSRTVRAFDPARTAFLRAVAGMVSLALAALYGSGGDGGAEDD
ncbi:winged helix-turn-helix domain-containing protein [Acrocarpospora macrocephala]|uniref:OmpR/PhoB-type domain-containing protein n=1 Tax=Acrocarpospora macrocephala TaxID=150177 RepID=A0A5M3X4D6_9ACTN|nr:winged helix-turn-helix domain-containing protein [Acrocarpospora macrocephala]GES14511.1 hypothetical protein Amac_081080 [Acrocarpospora macrocephala]